MNLTLDSDSKEHLPNGGIGRSTAAHSVARQAWTELPGLRGVGGSLVSGTGKVSFRQTHTQTQMYVHTDKPKNISGNHAIFISENRNKGTESHYVHRPGGGGR